MSFTMNEKKCTRYSYGKYSIVILSESTKGWRKDFNLISWNGATLKYVLRNWILGHEKMRRRVTPTKEEI